MGEFERHEVKRRKYNGFPEVDIDTVHTVVVLYQQSVKQIHPHPPCSSDIAIARHLARYLVSAIKAEL